MRSRRIVGRTSGKLFCLTILILVLIGGSMKWLSQDTTPIVFQPQDIERLRALLAQPKFGAHNNYPGAAGEASRQRMELKLNAYLKTVILEYAQKRNRQDFLGLTKNLLHSFDEEDSEDQDRLAEYVANIFEILHLPEEKGTIDRWRYGPLSFLLRR